MIVFLIYRSRYISTKSLFGKYILEFLLITDFFFFFFEELITDLLIINRILIKTPRMESVHYLDSGYIVGVRSIGVLGFIGLHRVTLIN